MSELVYATVDARLHAWCSWCVGAGMGASVGEWMHPCPRVDLGALSHGCMHGWDQ